MFYFVLLLIIADIHFLKLLGKLNLFFHFLFFINSCCFNYHLLHKISSPPNHIGQILIFQLTMIRQHLPVLRTSPHVVVHRQYRFNQSSVAVLRNRITQLVFQLSLLQLLYVFRILVKNMLSAFLLFSHRLLPIKLLIGRNQLICILVSRATNHYPKLKFISPMESILLNERFCPINCFDLSVYCELEQRKIFLQLQHLFVLNWRNLSILGGVQAFEQSDSRVDDEMLD